MTQEEEFRHQNVILEDMRHQMKLAFEGYQILERKIDQKFETLDCKIDKLDQKVDREFKGVRSVLDKLLEFMDEHDRWLKDHEVRIKALESR